MGELQDQDIPTIIMLGTIGILVLIAFIGLFILLYQKKMLEQKQKQVQLELDNQNQMIKMQIESQEQERKRIGADLHDSLGSLLWGAKVNASFIQRSAELQDQALTSYEDLSQILDESISVVRRISWELTPEAFHYSGLSESIKKMCSRLDGKGQKIIFTENGTRLWNDDRALQMFRVVQELINNAVKHSSATIIAVELFWYDNNLLLKVMDDGTGIHETDEKKGVGLWNIRKRIDQLSGKISIGNPPTHSGTEINIDVPLSI